MIQVGEVVETKKCFKSNQVDEKTGNILPIGVIEVRIGHYTDKSGQVRNIFARPLFFHRRIPLIGEHVLIISGPTVETTSADVKDTGFFYLSPMNSTDDLTFHHLPKTWFRKAIPGNPSSSPFRLADSKIPGYTFFNPPKKIPNLQPFEGDDLLEGRAGQSIRFTSTILGNISVYEQKPTWQGAVNGDPLLILRSHNFPPVYTPRGFSESAGIKKFHNPNIYTVENLSKDDSSLYLSTTQIFPSLLSSFIKPTFKELATLPIHNKSQGIFQSGRIVINAKDDNLFLLGKKKSMVGAKKVIFESEKYAVDLDDLISWLLDWWDIHFKMVSGIKQYATSAGPTLQSAALPDFTKLQVANKGLLNRFKIRLT